RSALIQPFNFPLFGWDRLPSPRVMHNSYQSGVTTTPPRHTPPPQVWVHSGPHRNDSSQAPRLTSGIYLARVFLRRSHTHFNVRMRASTMKQGHVSITDHR